METRCATRGGMSGQPSFEAFFRQATGYCAYEYQRALGIAERPPAVFDVPTGSGKTHALVTSWDAHQDPQLTQSSRAVTTGQRRELLDGR